MAFERLDLFATPFQHNLNGSKSSKKTILGAVTSLLIIGVSFSYLGYLTQMFFNGDIQPTVGTRNKFYSESYNIQFPSNLIYFQFSVNGTLIQDFEKEQGKKFITYIFQHTIQYANGTVNNILYSPIPCQDESLQGNYCIDYSQGGTQPDYLTFGYTPSSIIMEGFQLSFSYCNVYLESPDVVCATQEETQQLVANNNSGLIFQIMAYEYNPDTKQMEKKIQEEIFQIAPDLVVISQIQFVKQTLKVVDGIIIQFENDSEYIQSYVRQDSVQSFQNILTTNGYAIYSVVQFDMNQMGTQMKVQYPLITTILAQFSSVFNTLLIFGYFSKKLAQSQILQEFIDLQLKVYYKKTALELLQATESKKNTSSKTNVSSVTQGLSSLDLAAIYEKIRKMNYQKSIKHFLESVNRPRLFQKLKYLLTCQFKKVFQKNQESKQKKVYKKLIDQSEKAMNIFELHREILKLKMMIRMLLTVEQYAAIQVCGVELQADDQDLKKKNIEKEAMDKEAVFKTFEIDESQRGEFQKTISRTVRGERMNITQSANEQQCCLEDKTKPTTLIKDEEAAPIDQSFNNHLEKIDLLEKDQNYFEECLQNFLINGFTPKTETDKRIVDCLIGGGGENLKEKLKKQFTILPSQNISFRQTLQ